MYKPPFTISSKAINLIAKISAQIERYAIRMEQSDSLKLRKANRIKTIHSSLAIEGNTAVVVDIVQCDVVGVGCEWEQQTEATSYIVLTLGSSQV